MVIYAVSETSGHYGGYDDMNGEFQKCLGLFSSPELAINAINKEIEFIKQEMAKYDEIPTFVEMDPIESGGRNVIYAVEELQGDEDWHIYTVHSCELDKFEVNSNGVLF